MGYGRCAAQALLLAGIAHGVTLGPRTARAPLLQQRITKGSWPAGVWSGVIDQQMEMLETIEGVREVDLPARFAWQESEKHGVSLKTRCFESRDYRKVRMTAIDGGRQLQVFNSVWYPSAELDAPILGIDFLQFGGKKFLTVVDIQPLDKSAAYLEHYCAPADAIRQRYPDLCGERSTRFYEDDRYFSDQMLYGRMEDEALVGDVVQPAFAEYLAYYHGKVKGAQRGDAEQRARVMGLQADYDQWNAERDPAHAMFVKYFGDKWADDYLTDVLFELAEDVHPDK